MGSDWDFFDYQTIVFSKFTTLDLKSIFIPDMSAIVWRHILSPRPFDRFCLGPTSKIIKKQLATNKILILYLTWRVYRLLCTDSFKRLFIVNNFLENYLVHFVFTGYYLKKGYLHYNFKSSLNEIYFNDRYSR